MKQETKVSFSLAKFIQSSLEEIVTGVSNAQASEILKQHGAIANPRNLNFSHEKQAHYIVDSPARDATPRVEVIQFDVAVTVGEEKQTQVSGQGGGSIQVVAGSLTVEQADKNLNTNISRLTFSIPLKLPDAKR